MSLLGEKKKRSSLWRREAKVRHVGGEFSDSLSRRRHQTSGPKREAERSKVHLFISLFLILKVFTPASYKTWNVRRARVSNVRFKRNRTSVFLPSAFFRSDLACVLRGCSPPCTCLLQSQHNTRCISCSVLAVFFSVNHQRKQKKKKETKQQQQQSRTTECVTTAQLSLLGEKAARLLGLEETKTASFASQACRKEREKEKEEETCVPPQCVCVCVFNNRAHTDPEDSGCSFSHKHKTH